MENVKIKEGSGQGEKTAIHLMNPPTVIFDMADFEKAPEDIQNILILQKNMRIFFFIKERKVYHQIKVLIFRFLMIL